MSLRLAVLTPDPANPAYTTRVSPPTDSYRRLFNRLGVDLVAHPWVLGRPEGVDGTLATLAWGYHFRAPEWDAMLKAWGDAPPLINPPEVLLWNTRKTYLLALAEQGVNIIPTLTPRLTDPKTINAAFSAFDVDRIVIKPLISAGSNETHLIRRGDPLPAPAPNQMIQPFLPNVQSEGELSLFYFGGVFSHAVAKTAAVGDFRVQPQFGGVFRNLTPDQAAQDLAAAALDASPPGLLYARIDMLRGPDGRLALMELEAIEPDLYFDHAPDGGLAFGEAVVRRLAAAR